MFTSLIPNKSDSGRAVWERVKERTFGRGRLKKDVMEMASSLREKVINGVSFGQVQVSSHDLKVQLIRITKGFIRNFYPSVDYRGFEWHTMKLDQLKIDQTIIQLYGQLNYHERGSGAHRLFYGIPDDAPSSGLWVHFFHDGQGYSIRHRQRVRANRKHSSVPFSGSDRM